MNERTESLRAAMDTLWIGEMSEDEWGDDLLHTSAKEIEDHLRYLRTLWGPLTRAEIDDTATYFAGIAYARIIEALIDICGVREIDGDAA